MWYMNESDLMKRMVRDAVPNADVMANRRAVSHNYTYQPAPQVIPELLIYYPGYKEAVGDYRLEFLHRHLKHSDICQFIFDYCNSGENHIYTISEILQKIYEQGLNASINDSDSFRINILRESLNFEQFKILLYWITLQEEINYPISTGNMSVKLPFSRYCEAIYVSHTNERFYTINQIKRRADGRRRYQINQGLNYPQNLEIPLNLQNLVRSINS